MDINRYNNEFILVFNHNGQRKPYIFRSPDGDTWSHIDNGGYEVHSIADEK